MKRVFYFIIGFLVGVHIAFANKDDLQNKEFFAFVLDIAKSSGSGLKALFDNVTGEIKKAENEIKENISGRVAL